MELTVLPLELLLVGGVGGELHLESSDGSTGPLDRVLAQLELTVPPFVAPVPPKPLDMHPSPFPHPIRSRFLAKQVRKSDIIFKKRKIMLKVYSIA